MPLSTSRKVRENGIMQWYLVVRRSLIAPEKHKDWLKDLVLYSSEMNF